MADIHTVILVEDDSDFVYLIRKAVTKSEELAFPASAGSGEEGVSLAKQLSPDIVLMDINLPGSMDGIEAAREIRLATDARVLMLTSCEDPQTIINASRQAFASGYIFKSQCHALPETILRTARGITPQSAFIRELVLSALSSAERSIVEMLLKGNISLSSAGKTVANQKTSIFRKLGLRSTAELIHVFNHW